MPKRPCAVILTSDNSTIMCADKFGDIYSLPLIGQTYESVTSNGDNKQKTKDGISDSPQKPFVPSATSLTVHTKGNHEALRQQQKLKNPKAERKSMNFEHQLLLGHVSLLTDVVCASILSSSNRKRSYIISSDRDEHIRVSRGIPQAHIIEGYCLGHTEFVSKLCIPPTHPHLIISGGGDDFLLLWDWRSGIIRQKIDLRCPVEALKRRERFGHASEKIADESKDVDVTGTVEDKIAVSNIRIQQVPGLRIESPVSEIIVTCEG